MAIRGLLVLVDTSASHGRKLCGMAFRGCHGWAGRSRQKQTEAKDCSCSSLVYMYLTVDSCKHTYICGYLYTRVCRFVQRAACRSSSLLQLRL